MSIQAEGLVLLNAWLADRKAALDKAQAALDCINVDLVAMLKAKLVGVVRPVKTITDRTQRFADQQAMRPKSPGLVTGSLWVELSGSVSDGDIRAINDSIAGLGMQGGPVSPSPMPHIAATWRVQA